MNKILALSILMFVCFSVCAQPDGLELIMVIQDEVGNMLPMSANAVTVLYDTSNNKTNQECLQGNEQQSNLYYVMQQQEDSLECAHIIYEWLRLSLHEYAQYFF